MIQLYHDLERRMLLYEGADSARVAEHLPDALQVNGHCVAVPRTLRNLQVLRWLDLPVVEVMDGYDWPIERGKTPTAAQRTMANFMVLHPRCFNLSDMGTMKTLAALWAADFVMSHYPQGECRALVVCPLSIIQRVWGDAIFRNLLGRRTFEIVYGSAEKRLEQLALPADFYIINFDGVGVGARTRKKFELEGVSQILRDRGDIRIAVIDEAGAYRDSRTKRHRIARANLATKDYLWLLTGTPTPNGPTDAFGLAKLVNNAHGESWTSYRNRVMMQVSSFKWLPRAGSNEAARRLLQPAVRFDIHDVWDGPPATTQLRDVELTAVQKKMMAELKRDFQVTVNSGPITVPNEAAARQKFIQVSLGAIYDEHHEVHAVDAAPRLAELDAVIENAARKILIFAPLTSIVHLLYKHLSARWSCGVLNGEVSPKDRATIIRDYGSKENPRVMVADPQTTAHGINEFVVADTVVWFGPTDKAELYQQGNARVHRPGQQYPTTVVQLASCALEREIFRRLEQNLSLQGVLLQMVREGKL